MNKGTKIALWIGLPALAVGGVVAYRYFIAPRFQIIERTSEVDSKGKEFNSSGIYIFDNTQHPFGNVTGTIGGRFGWNLRTSQNKDGLTVFKLYKKDEFVKELAVA